MKKIIPAILTNDIADLQNKLAQLQGIADWVQIDIMDGKFVPNTSITLEDLSKMQVPAGISLEAHLMVENPETYFLQCQQSNIKRIIFHAETGDIGNVLAQAQQFVFQKGIALNPETPWQEILPYVSNIDVVLLMSVNPGQQGQTFIFETLEKIKELRQLAPDLKIEIDGGVNLETIKAVSDAGADYVVVGSGLFEAENIEGRFKELASKIS